MLKFVTLELCARFEIHFWLSAKDVNTEAEFAVVVKSISQLPNLVILQDVDGVAMNKVSCAQGVIEDAASMVIMKSKLEGVVGIVSDIAARNPGEWRWEGPVDRARNRHVK